MSVVVYPRLGTLLRKRDLTVQDLRRRIEAQIGLVADPKTLYRLTRSAAIRRADLEVAGAAAAVLGVALGDLFDVCVSPSADAPASRGEQEQARRSERLAALFAAQAAGTLSPEGWRELERLLAEYGHSQSAPHRR